jgi:hypothetical protein
MAAGSGQLARVAKAACVLPANQPEKLDQCHGGLESDGDPRITQESPVTWGCANNNKKREAVDVGRVGGAALAPPPRARHVTEPPVRAEGGVVAAACGAPPPKSLECWGSRTSETLGKLNRGLRQQQQTERKPLETSGAAAQPTRVRQVTGPPARPAAGGRGRRCSLRRPTSEVADGAVVGARHASRLHDLEVRLLDHERGGGRAGAAGAHAEPRRRGAQHSCCRRGPRGRRRRRHRESFRGRSAHRARRHDYVAARAILRLRVASSGSGGSPGV